MLSYTCPHCGFRITEADKSWDEAVSNRYCPNCAESLREFPVPFKPHPRHLSPERLGTRSAKVGEDKKSEDSVHMDAISVGKAHFCSSCGTPVAPDSCFCAACSTAVFPPPASSSNNVARVIVGWILSVIGMGWLLMSIFFGSNPSPTAYGFGEAIVTYFVPLAMLIRGTILLSKH